MNKSLLGLAVAAALAGTPALAQNQVKIGFVTTLSGPQAAIGQDMRDALELGLDHLGRKMGGLDVQVIYEDDAFRPETGKQKTEKLIQSDRVNFVAGYIWSNVILASLKPVVDSETFLISSNAGPSQIAGELCSPWYFSTSWQNDQTPMAMGEYMNQTGVKRAFLMSGNYAAGKDMLEGVKRTFKGEIVGQELTKWPDQLDFSAEMSKIRSLKPDAVFVFYPGAHGTQFLNQYNQSGLRGQIPLYTAFTIDSLSLPQMKELAVGVPSTQSWSPDLDFPANLKFVSEFRKKYNRYPSFYAAQTYDTVNLINSAVVAVDGDLTKKDEMRAEMRKANYDSVRGPYTYNNNHFPIQNFYLRDVVKDAEGNLTFKTIATVMENHEDSYHQNCKMSW